MPGIAQRLLAIENQVMHMQSISTVDILQLFAHGFLEPACGDQRIQLANIVRVENYVRMRICFFQYQVLDQELDITDTATAVLQIEDIRIAAIKFFAHSPPHGDNVIA